MKETIIETRQVVGAYVKCSFSKLIEKLTKAVDRLPDEIARNGAIFEIIDVGDYDQNYSLCIEYPRLETDAEEAKRIKEEEDKIYYEKILYEQLKVKFEK